MSRVSISDLETAAEWLDTYEEANEGSDNEAACKRVRDMLIKMADERRFEGAAREVAKKSGAPLAKARAALRRSMKD